MSEARKDDGGKIQMELLPPDALNEIAKVLTFGARKYAPRNWERGMNWGRVFGALMRHLWAYWGGEDRDPETGLPHLAHAGCCVLFLLSYQLRRIGQDDREIICPPDYTPSSNAGPNGLHPGRMPTFVTKWDLGKPHKRCGLLHSRNSREFLSSARPSSARIGETQ